MKIPIVFLGTGQAIPTMKRNHTSIWMEYKHETFLIDCGEGTQRQIRKAGLNPCKITKIFITHWHGDHILGIPGLLQTLALNGYNRKLEIYGPRGTKEHFSRIMGMFVFEGKIDYDVKEISSGKFLENEDYSFEALPMKHGIPCIAYSFIEKDKLRIDKSKMKKLGLEASPLMKDIKAGKDIVWKGKKVKAKDLVYEESGKKISFILDTVLNDNCYKISENADLLICESTYLDSDAEKAEEYLHMTAEKAAGIAKKSKVKKLILIHLSQRYEYKEKLVLAEAKKIFKEVIVGEDLMKIEI